MEHDEMKLLWEELDKLTEVVKKISDHVIRLEEAIDNADLHIVELLKRTKKISDATAKMECQLAYLPGGHKAEEILKAMKELKKENKVDINKDANPLATPPVCINIPWRQKK